MVDDTLIEEVGRQFIELAIKNAPARERDRLRQALEPPAPPLPGPPANPSLNDLIGDSTNFFTTQANIAPLFQTAISTPAVIPEANVSSPARRILDNMGGSAVFDFSGGEFRVGHADEWYRVGHINTASVRADTRSHFSSHGGVRERDYVQFIGYRLDATLDDVDRNASGFLIDAYNNHEPISPVSLVVRPEYGRAYQVHIASLYIDRLTLSNRLEIYLGGTIRGEMNMTELPP